MNPEEVYRIWAPEGGLWTPWVATMIFAELAYSPGTEELETLALPELGPACAIVLDLPGERSIRLATQLADARGYRPVPVIRAWPGPTPYESTWTTSIVNMKDLIESLCAATPHLLSLNLKPDALPVFALDSNRLPFNGQAPRETFDNRWKVFPQDLPSTEFLKSHGVESVLWVDESSQPLEDLSHVLLRWQEAGLKIHDGEGKMGDLRRPSHYRRPWQRELGTIRLHRNSEGGFGSKLNKLD